MLVNEFKSNTSLVLGNEAQGSLLHSFFLLLRPTLVADGGRTCDLLHKEATAVVKHSSRFLHKAFECVDMVTIER